METWGHRTNKRRYISVSTRLEATKLCSFVHMVTWGYVTNKMRYISTSARPCLLNLKRIWLMRSGHHPQWSYVTTVAWRAKNLCFHMAHDYQTRQDNALWYWTTMHKVAWFFDHVIIFSLVTNKNLLYLQFHVSYERQTFFFFLW